MASAVLVVTHDGAVAAMCDRVLHIRGGRLDGADPLVGRA